MRGNHLLERDRNGSTQTSRHRVAQEKSAPSIPVGRRSASFFNTPNKDKDSYFSSLYIIPIILGSDTDLIRTQRHTKNTTRILFQPKWKSSMFSRQ